jgi:hypothetical protein
MQCDWSVGNAELHGAERRGTIQRSARVELETVRCDQDAGNAELHGAEHQGTIHQSLK